MTVLEQATNQEAAAKAAWQAAQSRLKTAYDALTAAEKALSDALALKAAEEKTIAGLRAQLEEATVPSVIAGLVSQLTEHTQALRALHGDVVQKQLEAEQARANHLFAGARLSRAERDLQEATRALSEAKAAHDKREKLRAAYGTGGLGALPTEAADILSNTGTTLLSDAEAALGTVPEKLLELAEARHRTKRQRLENAQRAVEVAEDGLGAQHESDHGVTGAVCKARVALARRERAFSEFVTGARGKLDWAKSVLAQLKALHDDGRTLLTAEEADDAAEDLATRDPVAVEAKDLAALERTRDEKWAAFADRTLEVQARDPAQDDLSGDTDWAAAKSEYESAAGALEAAEGDLDGSERETLRAWQLVLPDAAWQKLVDFFEAKAVLEELKDTPSTLQSDMDAAEDALATALGEAAASAATIGYYEDALAHREALAKAAASTAPLHIFSGVRGDAI